MMEESFYVVIMIVLYRTGDRLSRYFIAGTFCLAIGILFGLLSNTVFGIDLFYYVIFNEIGIVTEIFCFSLGLGYRMKLNEQQRMKTQEELIAQLRLTEEIQSKQNEVLEERVASRVAEVEQQKEQIEHQRAEIEIQNRDLVQLNEEKNNLIRIVAHDLKSPLSRINGLINVIRLDTSNLNREQVAYTGMIDQSIHQLQQMVNRILSADTLTGQAQKLQLEKFDLVKLIEQVLGLFQKQAQQKKIYLESEMSMEVHEIISDRSYLESILENLISNAIKFSTYKTKVCVGLRPLNEQQFTLIVKDEGPGFTDKDKQKLFRKYQQLTAKPTAGESSTGLGLSIVKKYTHLLKGEIRVESEAGKGACFYLTFPKVVS